MVKSFMVMGVGIFVFVLTPSLGWTEPSDERMRKWEQDLSKMRKDLETLKQERAESAKDSYKLPISFFGSITARYESTNVDDPLDLRSEDVRDGFRSRVRFGAKFAPDGPDGPVTAGIRLTTGETASPTTPFIRFGNLIRSESFNLDQFWLGVDPLQFFDTGPKDSLPAHLSLVAGRMPQPFWRGEWNTWSSEMIWDRDVNPQGFVGKISVPNLAPSMQLQATGGYFVIQQLDDFRFSGFTKDTYLVAEQLKAEYSPVGALAVTLYGFNDLNAGLFSGNFNPGSGAVPQPGRPAQLLSDPNFQRTNNQVTYGPGAVGFVDNQFNVLNVTGQLHACLPFLETELRKPEVYLVGDYANNTSVSEDKDGFGFTLGLHGGKQDSGVNPFDVWATYRNVDNDATLATIADSDLGVGTGYRGVGLGANYRLHKHLLAQISGYDFSGFPQKDRYWQRLFVDMVVDF